MGVLTFFTLGVDLKKFFTLGCTPPHPHPVPIYVDNPQYGEIRELLNVPNAQLSLTSNILLIYTTKYADSLHGFFDQNQLKIGLNANIFLVLQSNLEDILYQALGTGTTEVEIKVFENFLNQTYILFHY